MAAGVLDLLIEQGVDNYIIFTVEDTNGNPVDITGESYAGQIRSTYNGTLIADFSFTILNQITNKGQVQALISEAVSSAIIIPVGKKSLKYRYDIDRTFVDTHVERFLQGKATISAEVTEEGSEDE